MSRAPRRKQYQSSSLSYEANRDSGKAFYIHSMAIACFGPDYHTLSPVLDVSATSDFDCLAIHVRKQRAARCENGTGSLGGTTRSTKGNILVCRGIVALPARQLCPWDTQCDALTIGGRDESTLLLGLRQTGIDMTESNGICSDAKLSNMSVSRVSFGFGFAYLRAPFLCNGLGQARYTSLGQAVVGLSGVAMCTTGGADVDNDSVLAIFDPEVLGRLSYESEGRRVMHRQDGVPLLVRHLVNDAVPGIPSVIDDDVDLAVAELSSFLNQHGEVVEIGHIAGHRDRTIRQGIVYGFGNGFGFGAVDITYNDFGAFVGEQPGAFGTNTLA